MGVDKVILRAFLSTFAAIIILLVFMFTALIVIYPQTMMALTYDLGMESSSIYFAEESYKRTDEVYYIAYAMEVAIGEENTEKIVSCGEKLIGDKAFEEYCQGKDEILNEGREEKLETTYQQYVYGQVCVGMYINGEKERAVERAFILVGEKFPRNNAIVALVIAAKNVSDNETVDMIKGKMNELKTKNLDNASSMYLDEILARLAE